MNHSPPIRVGALADGSLAYLVDLTPQALPSVLRRDLEAAWEAAREGRGNRAVTRGFRFRAADGSYTDLTLADPDARVWAASIERRFGLHTGYGLSLYLRLLALVDLLGRPRWAGLRRRRGSGELHPALLRAAAITPLTGEARFEDTAFHARLGRNGPALSLA